MVEIRVLKEELKVQEMINKKFTEIQDGFYGEMKVLKDVLKVPRNQFKNLGAELRSLTL